MSDVHERFACVGITTMDPRDSRLGGVLPKWETQGGMWSSGGESVGVAANEIHDSEWGGTLPKWETQGTMRSSDGNALTVDVAANETHDSEWGGMLPKWETQGAMRSSDKKGTKALEVVEVEDISLAGVALLSSLAAGVSSSSDGHSAAAEISPLGLCHHAGSGSPAIVDVPARTNTIHWTERSKHVSVDAGERKANHGTYHA